MTRWISALLLSWSVAAAVGQPAQASRMFNVEALLNDLRVLSSDDMQGRGVDTPGGEKARTFIVERFKASGIAPIGSSYLEPFVYGVTHGVNVVGEIAGKRTPR